MKVFNMIIMLVFLGTLCSYAEVADLQIQNERVEDNVFKFEITIQRTDAWASDGLGDADFYFYYNESALSDQPRVSDIHPAIDGNTSYAVSTKINGGLLLVKIDFAAGGGLPWLPGLNLAEQICTVEMDILDGSQNSQLEWDAVNTGALTSAGAVIEETFVGSGDISLPVELSFFHAEYIEGAVEITWRTESEFNNWGFNVYRSETQDGLYERVNSSLINGAGYSSMPKDYRFVDERIAENTTYFYRLEDVDTNGKTRLSAPVRVQTGGDPVATATTYDLEQNYPNPFNPETTIGFTLEASEDIVLEIYDLNSRLVRTLAKGRFAAGKHTVLWNGLNESGAPAPSGTYLYKLQTRGFQQSKKLTLIR